MSQRVVTLEREGFIATVKINSPPVNALSASVIKELDEVFREIEGDAQVRAVVLTGAGEKAFVAGADIKGFLELPDSAAAVEFSVRIQSLFDFIEVLPVPVIAAIKGFCLGGGNELAMACDLRIAGESAVFGQPEISLGIMPGAGGTQRLPRLVGKGRAKELIYTGKPVPAQEAYRIGLVNQVVPDAGVLTAARELAEKLAAQAPVALNFCKSAIDQGMETTMIEGQQMEANYFGELFKTDDMKEGVSAFLQKRKPLFKGR